MKKPNNFDPSPMIDLRAPDGRLSEKQYQQYQKINLMETVIKRQAEEAPVVYENPAAKVMLEAMKMCLLGIGEALDKGASIDDARKWARHCASKTNLTAEQIDKAFYSKPADILRVDSPPADGDTGSAGPQGKMGTSGGCWMPPLCESKEKCLFAECDLLSPNEQAVIQALVEAWKRFLELERIHPDDGGYFRAAIHKCQLLVMARPVQHQLNRFNDAEEEESDSPVFHMGPICHNCSSTIENRGVVSGEKIFCSEECSKGFDYIISSHSPETPKLGTRKRLYSNADQLKPGDEFYWKKTDLVGNGLVYYICTHIVDGIVYAYQEHHPSKVLPIDMGEEVYITGRKHLHTDVQPQTNDSE